MREQILNQLSSLPFGERLIAGAAGHYDSARRAFAGEEIAEENQTKVTKTAQAVKKAVVSQSTLLTKVQGRTVELLRKAADVIEKVQVPSEAVAESADVSEVVEAAPAQEEIDLAGAQPAV